jgi:hypothetical protein
MASNKRDKRRTEVDSTKFFTFTNGAKQLYRIRKMKNFGTAFVNQGLAPRLRRIAPPKYGKMVFVSILTNKKGPDSAPDLFYSVNRQRFQRLPISTASRRAW